LYDAEARARRTICVACGRAVRVRLVRHESALQRRAQLSVGHEVVAREEGLYVLAEDVRSLWNVGSLFRTADGLGVAHLFLCGITGIPPHPDIQRTALGAHEVVSWSYTTHGFAAVDAARRLGCRVVALETTDRSVPLRAALCHRPMLLIVGNEVDGVSPELLERADETVHIPMHGIKHSLNVAVAAGIALWHYTHERPTVRDFSGDSPMMGGMKGEL